MSGTWPIRSKQIPKDTKINIHRHKETKQTNELRKLLTFIA